MNLILNSSNTEPYQPGRDFSVAIVCGDSAAATSACEVLELVEENLNGAERLFYQWWNFDVLATSTMRELELAATEAATADMLIICIRAGPELPVVVTDWMNQWLVLRKDLPGLLVALMDAGLKMPDASREILLQLRNVATLAQMDFIAARSGEIRDAVVPRRFNDGVRHFVTARRNKNGLAGEAIVPPERAVLRNRDFATR